MVLKHFFKPIGLWVLLSSMSQLALAQGREITGKVIDNKDRSALSNVSVIARGTQTGTQTDSNGNFHFTVPASIKWLTVSAIGYSSQDIDVNQTDHIEVRLESTASSLDEVVVIGYGTARKKDLTGAVASVQEKDFNKGTFTSPDLLIQGKVSGVQIMSNNGSPGAATTIRIRGNSAITGTGQPLFVVDGVPLDGRSLERNINPLNFLNPIDIASIDILKDASATAIYGSRAAYGVVIINTKKGKTGETKIDVAISVGASSALKKLEILNATQYREAIQYWGVDPSFDKGGDADAQDAILQTGWQQNYSIAGSGGNENGRYRFSAGYLDQDGIVSNTSFKKYTGDFSANLKCLKSKKLGLDLHLNSSQYIQEGSNISDGNGGSVFFALIWNPTVSLRNKDSSLRMSPAENVNPIAYSQYARDNLKVTTLLGSISPYYKFTDWLDYRLLLGINYSSGISRSSTDQALGLWPMIFSPTGYASIANNELTTQQITQTLNFNKEIFHELRLNAVLGYEYMKFTSQGFSLSASGNDATGFGNYGIDYTDYIQFSSQGSRRIASYLDPISELQSFFGRTIFTYREKYLLTATLRADGSSKFGANNKYGYFPSFAAAWDISKEDFFKLSFINSMKVRIGWGKTGNQEFPAGSSQALYSFQNGGGLRQTNNANPDLKWQSDRQYNVGVDFSICNNRVSGTMDYFNKSTTHLLFPSPPIQPAPPNSTVQWINLDGQILNKGFEIMVNGGIIRQENFSWDLSVNASFLNNNVSGLTVPLYTGDVGSPVEIIQNGHPMNTFYTRKFLGLDKSGQSVYEDDGNTFYYLGDPNPKTLLGVTSTFRFKKFSLTANMYGAFGQRIFNADLFNWLTVYGIMGRNMALSVYENPVKESLTNPAQSPSSRYIQNGNYLKMGNLTLSYAPGDIGKAFKGTNIYVTAQNLFLITKYEGFDPEVNADRSINGVPSFGIDNVRYPSSRTFIVGINFSL